MTDIVFETERLLVREIERDDFEQLNRICSDPELMKFVGDSNPLSPEQTLKWIEVTICNYMEKGFGNYAVIEKTGSAFIGYCGLVYSESINQIELIYALKKEYWNKGLATEVAIAMLDFGHSRKKIETIYASIDPLNVASKKVLEKIGFKYAFLKNDEFGLPSVYYSSYNPKNKM